MTTFDRIIRGGTAATGSDIMIAGVGVKARRIAAPGVDLGSAGAQIDARGKLVLAGGIDSHVYIAQPRGPHISYNSEQSGVTEPRIPLLTVMSFLYPTQSR
jgi:dihydropyrimidinase